MSRHTSEQPNAEQHPVVPERTGAQQKHESLVAEQFAHSCLHEEHTMLYEGARNKKMRTLAQALSLVTALSSQPTYAEQAPDTDLHDTAHTEHAVSGHTQQTAPTLIARSPAPGVSNEHQAATSTPTKYTKLHNYFSGANPDTLVRAYGDMLGELFATFPRDTVFKEMTDLIPQLDIHRAFDVLSHLDKQYPGDAAIQQLETITQTHYLDTIRNNPDAYYTDSPAAYKKWPDVIPQSFEAHVAGVIQRDEPAYIEEALNELSECAHCAHDEVQRQAYAVKLFSMLPPEVVLEAAHNLHLLPNPAETKLLVREAVEHCADNPDTYQVLAENYALYKAYLDTNTRDEMLLGMTTHPLGLAKTLAKVEQVAPLFQEARTLVRDTIATHGVSEEDIAGELHTLRSAYDADTVATIVIAQAEHDPTLLYDMRSEIIWRLSASAIEQIAEKANLKHDPYIVLDLLHHLRTSGHPDTPERTALTTRTLKAIGNFRTPQITLHDAALLHTHVGDNPEAYDTIIFSALEQCIDSLGYRVILDYSMLFEDNVTNKDLLQEKYQTAALSAYTTGDYVSFLDLYTHLDDTGKELLVAEHALASNAWYGSLSPEALEKYGTDLNPGLAFVPSDLPFPRDDMEQYIAKTVRTSMTETLRLKTFHGQQYSEYGWSNITIPIERFNTILYSDAFAKELKQIGMPYSYANVFSLVHAVHRMLEKQNTARSDQEIGLAAHTIIEYQRTHLHDEIVGPNTQLILATHKESKFNNDNILKNLYEAAGGTEKNILNNKKGVEYKNGVNTVKSGLLETISTASDGQVVLILSGHGSAENWSFAENTAANQEHSLDPAETRVSYKELATALESSGNMRNFRIVVASCNSYDYLKNLDEYLQEQDVVERPTISISEANKGRYGWVRDELAKGDLVNSFLLNALSHSLHTGPNSKQGLTLGDALRAEGRLLHREDIGIFLGEPADSTEPTNSSTQPKNKAPTPDRVIEIGMRGLSPEDSGTAQQLPA